MRPITLISASIVLGSLAGSELHAQAVAEWGPDILVNAPNEGHLRPRIELNADGNPVVLWYDAGPGRNFTAVGDGSAFSLPVQVNPVGLPPTGADWQGSDLHADGNTLWVAMKGTPEESMGIYLIRSDDGGFTWGDTVRVDTVGAWSRFPTVSSNAEGEPLVQFMEFNGNFLLPRHVVARSVGGAFADPVQVSTPFASGEACDCCTGQIIAADDVVVAMYRNNDDNTRVMYGAVSTDGGTSFPTGGMLDDSAWEIFACPSSGPDGYITGDSIRYVWMSGETGMSRVHARSAAINGLGTGTTLNLHSGVPENANQNYPRIAGSGDTLGVVWQENVSSQYHVLFSWSTTGFNGLSVPDTVNSAPTNGRTPDVAYRDGRFHLTWGQVSGSQVHYRSVDLSGTIGIAEEPASDRSIIWPQPATDWINVRHGATGIVDWALVDATGRTTQLSSKGDRVYVGRAVSGAYSLLGRNKLGQPVVCAKVLISR